MTDDIADIEQLIKDTLVSVSPEYKKMDFGKKPVKKEKEIISSDNQEGLNLLDTEEADYISFGEIKLGRTYKVKENIEDWTPSDFFHQLKELYINTFDEVWDFNFGGTCQEITRLHDAIVIQNGFCNSIVLRDYIEFYFKRYARKISASNKKFNIFHMRDERPIHLFISKYNFKLSFNKEVDKRESKRVENIKKLGNKPVENSLLVGEENFLAEYGFVIFVNWFVIAEGRDKIKTIKKAIMLCRELFKNNSFDGVLDVTAAFAPYPKWFVFKNVNKFLEKIDNDLNLEIEFLTNIETDRKYGIMREKHD